MQHVCSEFQEVMGEETMGHTQLLSSISKEA